jgi:hypothetical protein
MITRLWRGWARTDVADACFDQTVAHYDTSFAT